MGFLSSLFGRRSVEQPDIVLKGDGQFRLAIVGESHYQETLGRMAGGRSSEETDIEFTAELVLEDENPHDPKAVAVRYQGDTLGYLSRSHAREMREMIAPYLIPGRRIWCQAKVFGGYGSGKAENRAHYGVWLDPGDEDWD